MDDKVIVQLFWERKESAISAVMEKYSPYCFHIAVSIVGNSEDAGECVNDIWLKAWNSIPPHRPQNLAAFLGKLTRNTAIDRFRRSTRKRRGGSEAELALDELAECVSNDRSMDGLMEERELTELINSFLGSLPEFDRNVFVCRYWYFESVKEIAHAARAKESRIKSSLFRTRKKLRDFLKEEGYDVEK